MQKEKKCLPQVLVFASNMEWMPYNCEILALIWCVHLVNCIWCVGMNRLSYAETDGHVFCFQIGKSSTQHVELRWSSKREFFWCVTCVFVSCLTSLTEQKQINTPVNCQLNSANDQLISIAMANSIQLYLPLFMISLIMGKLGCKEYKHPASELPKSSVFKEQHFVFVNQCFCSWK